MFVSLDLGLDITLSFLLLMFPLLLIEMFLLVLLKTLEGLIHMPEIAKM